MNAKSQTRTVNRIQRAFTLIELLVVIAVIAILAGLLFTAMPAINRARTMSTARAELTQITTAIEAYKAKYGVYPPDSLGSTRPSNPLYYELTGAIIEGGNYRGLADGSHVVATSLVTNTLKVPGILNSSTSTQGTDDKPAIESFMKELKPLQYTTKVFGNAVRVLSCSVDGDAVWYYNSTNPTNNPNSYDLWVDVTAGGRTNRVANWNK